MSLTLTKPPTVPQQRYEPRPDAPGHGQYVSEEEYWADWYGGTVYEWNNGYLEAKPMSTPSQFNLYSWFLLLLLQYQLTLQNVQIMALETGFTMVVPDPDSPGMMKKVTRKPDIGAIVHTNPVLWGDDHRSYHGICDLCIESISDSVPSEMTRDTEIKFAEYEFSGVKEYYILDPDHRHMLFYVRNRHGNYEEIKPDANGVIRSTVLPGFQFRLRDLNTMPSLEELALDEVYRGYVLLKYQESEARAMRAEQTAAQERQRAEKERQRAEEERRQAEAERQRSARLAAKLRDLGLDPSELLD